MKERLEYRKASAEALGLKLLSGRVMVRDEYDKDYPNKYNAEGVWHPDKDANQMLMVWEWLKKQKYYIRAEYEPDGHDFLVEFYKMLTTGKMIGYCMGYGTDLKLATMKAFMEYFNLHK